LAQALAYGDRNGAPAIGVLPQGTSRTTVDYSVNYDGIHDVFGTIKVAGGK